MAKDAQGHGSNGRGGSMETPIGSHRWPSQYGTKTQNSGIMDAFRGTSGTNKFADTGARGFATSTQNTDAANELYSGPKSRMVPVHDSMGGAMTARRSRPIN